jgi:hypothetical protein
MWKPVLAVVAGILVWMAVVTVSGVILRLSWPAYADVAAAMAFTLAMLIARLSISALATLVMGAVTARIVPRSTIARLVPGVLLLAVFIPVHVGLWNKFPAWYHLTFLLSLVPLGYAGGMISSGRAVGKTRSVEEGDDVVRAIRNPR